MTTFTCTECYKTYTKWTSKCVCGSFALHATKSNIPDVYAIENGERISMNYEKQRYRSQLLSEVKPEQHKRISTGIAQFDNVLSGGFVPGSVTLIGGDPGIGKSTLLLESLTDVSVDLNALYVSGEESEQQVAERARCMQLSVDSVNITRETKLKAIFSLINRLNIRFIVLDSIQTITDDSIPQSSGSLSQVKRCAIEISKYAKAHKVTFVIVCHVSKDGSFAGPKALEHFVDTVLYFQGDENSDKRLLRVTKNRYGSTNKFGVFTMTENGLIGE